MAAAGFLSHYLSGPLPYVRRHITVLSASLNKTFDSFLPSFNTTSVLLFSTCVLSGQTYHLFTFHRLLFYCFINDTKTHNARQNGQFVFN